VQLKPSIKREISGCAVVVNMVCWDVEGPCTWSKLNVCFLLVEGAAAVADAAAPAPGGADEEPSTETVVWDIACITAL
jgi:hypothetical protein